MPPSEPVARLYNTYEIETEVGTRRLEFDPDVILGRDVRILVDGASVVAVPYPKPATPFHEVAFEIDGHPLVGAIWLPPESDSQGLPLGYDVFEGGRSLSGRPALADVRIARSTPRRRYPMSFTVLDALVRVAPAAAAPGAVAGLGASVTKLGWGRAIGVMTFVIGGIGAASALGARLWQLVRAREDQSERRRAAMGWIAVLSAYAVVILAMVALVVTYVALTTPH